MADRDPLQGLINYVKDVKPYHTKILDIVLEYVHNEDVDVSIVEELDIETTIIRLCNDNDGYGNIWDPTWPYVVVDAGGLPPGSANEIVLPGLHADLFEPGTNFEVREPVSISPQILSFTVDAVVEGGSPERTIIVTTTPVNPSSFFVPPYPLGNESFGDVFVVHDVLETDVATNTITVSGNQSQKESFYYGRTFEIRNASNSSLNRLYSVQSYIPGNNSFGILVAGSPVPATSVNDGELVIIPAGFDYEEFCGSPQVFQGYQYFIVETDTIANTFTVYGDATSDVQVGVFNIKVENAIAPGVPITLNQNNGAYSVLSTVYDQTTNTTEIEVSPQIIDPYPTGYIIPV